MEENERVTRGVDRKPQVRRVSKNQWTTAKQRIFFEHLAATCNVKHAADRAGMTQGGAYAKRRIDPVFRATWAEALETAYAKLETMLIARAAGTATAGGAAAMVDYDPDAHREVTEALDSQLALQLMAAHRAALHSGRPRPGGGKPTTADMAQVEASIRKQLDALAKRREAAK